MNVTQSIAKTNAQALVRLVNRVIGDCVKQGRNPEPDEMRLIQTQAELVEASIEE